MKKTFLLMLALSLVASTTFAQKHSKGGQESFHPSNVEKYDLKVNTSCNVAQKISKAWERQADALSSNNRGAFLDGLFAAGKTAAFGVLGQGGSAAFSATFATLTSAMKSKKSEWRKVVQKESSYKKKLFMLENIDDFYSNVSNAGALDPSGLAFNGFACLQQRGTDTVLYVSCSLDTSETALMRILKHSKFQLHLDTLVFNPTLCNLPNDSARCFSERKPFSFAERKSIALVMDVEISSSWINQAIQTFEDVRLGRFAVSVPITEASIGSDGKFRYVSGADNNTTDCRITGDCFIVPRSYIGVRDAQGEYHDAWGTGQYKTSITISETCGITKEFEKNWKADWKSRPQKTTIGQDLAQSLKQVWNQNSKSWICTLTEAPINYTKQQITSALGMTDPTAQKQGGQFNGVSTGKGVGTGNAPKKQ